MCWRRCETDHAQKNVRHPIAPVLEIDKVIIDLPILCSDALYTILVAEENKLLLLNRSGILKIVRHERPRCRMGKCSAALYAQGSSLCVLDGKQSELIETV